MPDDVLNSKLLGKASAGNANEPPAGSNTHGEMLHVAFKAPEFSPATCTGWFDIVEAQFDIANITKEETKFVRTLSSLPPTCVDKLPREIIRGRSYEALKQRVLGLYERSQAEIFDQLIAKSSLGMSKPSIFLIEIQQQAQKVGVSDELVRHKFIQAMPDDIRAVIAASAEDLNLSQLGSLADNLISFARMRSGGAGPINAVADTQPGPSHSRDYSRDHNRDQSQGRDQGGHVSRRDFSNVPIGVRPYYKDQKPAICRAHLFFHENARTCKAWCKYPKKKKELKIEPNSRAASPTTGNGRGN